MIKCPGADNPREIAEYLGEEPCVEGKEHLRERGKFVRCLRPVHMHMHMHM